MANLKDDDKNNITASHDQSGGITGDQVNIPDSLFQGAGTVIIKEFNVHIYEQGHRVQFTNPSSVSIVGSTAFEIDPAKALATGSSDGVRTSANVTSLSASATSATMSPAFTEIEVEVSAPMLGDKWDIIAQSDSTNFTITRVDDRRWKMIFLGKEPPSKVAVRIDPKKKDE